MWQNNLKNANHTLNLFVANSAPSGSGGVEMNQVTTMTVDNCNFTLGTGSKGGAVYTQVCVLHLPVKCILIQSVLHDSGCVGCSGLPYSDSENEGFCD